MCCVQCGLDSGPLASGCVWAGSDSVVAGSVIIQLELQDEKAAPDSPLAQAFAIDCEPASASVPRAPTSPGTPWTLRSLWLNSRGSLVPGAPWQKSHRSTLQPALCSYWDKTQNRSSKNRCVFANGKESGPSGPTTGLKWLVALVARALIIFVYLF